MRRKNTLEEKKNVRGICNTRSTRALILTVLLTIYVWNRLDEGIGRIYLDDIYTDSVDLNSSPKSSDLSESLSKDIYPYVTFDLLSGCGLTSKTVTDQDPYLLQPSHTLNQSIAFIKTHKTGSSTLANMVWRWVHARDLKRMVPRTGKNLGWPSPFPGKKWFFKGKKFDAIYNHAVFNNDEFDKYMKQPGTKFTILREPLARTISAINYYMDKTPYGFKSWRALFSRLKSNNVMKTYDFYVQNGMAFDLGWYEQHNYSKKFDQNVTEIQAFIDTLDKQLDVVMIMERMDESLLLLRDAIPGLSISEFVYRAANVNGNDTVTETKLTKVYPNEKETEKLSEIILVDRMIYDHFNKRLTREWNSKVRQSPHLEELKDGLSCLQKKIDDNFENDRVISEEMKVVFSEWIL